MGLIVKIENTIVSPLISLLFVLALAYFLWGIFEFVRDSSSEDGRQKGISHMRWGVIGLFIMASVKGIMALITASIGVQ